MSNLIVVKSSSVSLTAVIPTLLFDLNSHTLSKSPSGDFVTSDGNEVLLESDIDEFLSFYETPYKFPPYISVPGKLKYQSIKTISSLSDMTQKNGEAIVTKITEGTITCSVEAQAQFIPPSPAPPQLDATPTYDLDHTFTDAGQAFVKSD